MTSVLRWLWKKFPQLRQIFGNKVREAMLEDPRYSAKFWPYLPEKSSYLVEAVPLRRPDDPLPLPPVDLRWGVLPTTDEQFLRVGEERVKNMAAALQQGGGSLDSCRRVLELGVASGIMLRWLVDLARRGEVWGVDLSGAYIMWCQQNLSPPFRFVTTTSAPHLPFEDNYFDLVYAGSVFTHIADLADAWVLELKRIVRPGGYLYLTVHDEHTLELYRQRPKFAVTQALAEEDAELRTGQRNWDFFTIDRNPDHAETIGSGKVSRRGQAQVFYRREYLRHHWGQYLKVVSVHPEAYRFAQTAFLLQKESRDTPRPDG